MSQRLRAATTNDIERLGEIDAYVQRLHHEAHPEIWKPPDIEGSTEFFRLRVGDDRFTIAVSQDNAGFAVGYALVQVQDEAESTHRHPQRLMLLEHLSVLPEHQREGRGSEMLDWAESEAHASRCIAVRLNVWAFNSQAISLYERHGFEHISSRMLKQL